MSENGIVIYGITISNGDDKIEWTNTSKSFIVLPDNMLTKFQWKNSLNETITVDVVSSSIADVVGANPLYIGAIRDIIVMMILDDFWLVNPMDEEPFSHSLFGQCVSTFFSELPISDE